MSDTVQVTDQFMATHGATAPQQAAPLVVDPQYGSIRMVTPFCRFAYVTLVNPKQIKQRDGKMGAPQFSLTALFNPQACGDMYNAIVAVASHRFQPEDRPNPQNPNEIIKMDAVRLFSIPEDHGGLHYPLRRGFDSYMRDPKKFELWRPYLTLNMTMMATDRQGNAQRPVVQDEAGMACDPAKIYSGCYGRLFITFYAYPKVGAQSQGGRGVGVGVQAVQFARHGDRMGGFDAQKASQTAFAAAGQIPVEDANQVGFGHNTIPQGQPAPGAPVQGFAAPPGAAAGGATQQSWQTPAGYVAPNPNPAGPPGSTGARPPGAPG